MIPIPIVDLTAKQLAEWEELHEELIRVPVLNQGPSKKINKLLGKLNILTANAFGLGRAKAALISDLVHVKKGLEDGKMPEEAVRPPSKDEMERCADSLRSQLDAFLGESSHMWHEVTVLPGSYTVL